MEMDYSLKTIHTIEINEEGLEYGRLDFFTQIWFKAARPCGV